MRLKSILLSGAVAAAFLNLPLFAPGVLVSTAQAQSASISFSVFYDGLRDDGDWTDYNGNYVFVPSNIDANWRPYTRGHWVHTAEFGWVWKSDERFGWATYHYGRWGYARDIGWYWVPGKRWAPAWVSWRRTDSEVLWAPLPPNDYGDDGVVNAGTDATLSALPFYFWVSIPTRNFQDPDLSARIVFDQNQNQRIFERSHFDGHVVIQNNIVINNVINQSFIQQQTGKPVQNVAVTTTTNPGAAKSPQPGRQNMVTAFQGQLKVDPAVKPVDVKPVAQVQQKVVNQPKLPTDTPPPPAAGAPAAGAPAAAGATKPATGAQPQGNVAAPVPTPKPGEAVTPPKDGVTVVPSKPVDAATPPKAGAAPVVTPVAPKVDALPVPKGNGVAIPPALPMNKQLKVTPPVQAKPIPANPPAVQVMPKQLPKDVVPAPHMRMQPLPPKAGKPAGNPKPPPPPPALIKKPVPPDKVPACKDGGTDCPPQTGN